MKLTTFVLAGTATFLISGSPALAQAQAQAKGGQHTGQVTLVNRLNNTIAVRPIQEGTVGANTVDASEQFKVKDGVSLEDLHAGNHISYSVTEQGGTRTITSFKRQ